MIKELVTETLVSYLLGVADGFRFEKVIQDLLAIRDDDQFVALGGVHDGGADGFIRSVLEEKGKPKSFVQMGKQENVRDKVRKTHTRLKEFGREVESINFWSPLKLHVDVLEDELTNELGITIRIRDFNAVHRLINHDTRTREHFLAAFRTEIHELTAAGSKAPEGSDFVSDPSVYVFLQFENKERFGKGGLTTPVVDALIYWSLRDTDPDSGKKLTRAQIKVHISELLPGAANELLPIVDQRLVELTSKGGGGEQRVRVYADIDSYCLPYAMRIELAAASAGEVALKAAVRQSMSDRAAQAGAVDVPLVVDVCERAIYKHFHEQGLILAAFLEKRLEGLMISDQIVESELQAVVGKGKDPDTKSYSAALKVLQGIFYTPNPDESEFLHRLSRTSLLLFSLKHCPKLIQYFNKLTGQFRLLIGTDILVKALSESFLPVEHRHVTNLLKVANACGAKLCLTAPVVKELFTHLHAACLEFRNYYAEQEPYITASMAAQSDRILIRTYFYAKLLMERVSGWKSFVNMFVDYEEVISRSEKGALQLQAFICKTFDLEMLSLDEITPLIKEAELTALAADLLNRNVAKNEALARNDALMVLSVYALRRSGKEVAIYDGFGLRTWWLTKETHVLGYTAELVARSGGVPYIMRPEFLLNFLTLSPKTGEVDPAIRDLLPSHVGLQIGRHLSSAHMQRFMNEFDQWKELPPARVEVRITEAIDKLKYDRLKRYGNNLDLNGDKDIDALVSALKAA